MIVRRLSIDALFLVLVCLVLGTLVLAQTSVRALSVSGARSGAVSGVTACMEEMTCAAQHGPSKARPPTVHV